MKDSEAEDFLLRLEKGDQEAVAPLMSYSYAAVRRSVRDRVPPDLIPDCVQAVFLSLWKAVQAGRYQYQGIPQFFSYITMIARSEARRARRYCLREAQFPTSEDSDTQWDPPAPEHPEPAVEMPLMLSELLDKALIESARGPTGKDLGLLKKLAFQCYYVDGLSQKEIVAQLGEYANHLKLSVTADNLNNWLSGGRILKTVVTYLVEHRQGGASFLIGHVLDRADVTQGQREVVHLYWCCGKEVDDIAAERRSTPEVIQDLLDNGIAALVAAIKKQLHEGRRKSG